MDVRRVEDRNACGNRCSMPVIMSPDLCKWRFLPVAGWIPYSVSVEPASLGQ